MEKEDNIQSLPIASELLPIVKQLQNEGFDVYSYISTHYKEVLSLYWYENGRILSIQPTVWYNSNYARNLFDFVTSYKPGSGKGSACGLLPDDIGMGWSAKNILKYRNVPTWVKGIENYKSMKDYLDRETILIYYKLDSVITEESEV